MQALTRSLGLAAAILLPCTFSACGGAGDDVAAAIVRPAPSAASAPAAASAARSTSDDADVRYAP